MYCMEIKFTVTEEFTVTSRPPTRVSMNQVILTGWVLEGWIELNNVLSPLCPHTTSLTVV